MRKAKLTGLVLLCMLVLIGPACGASNPEWCSGRYTSLHNYKYGYEVFYPVISSLSQMPDDYLYIDLPDAGSSIEVAVYEYPHYTIAELYEDFETSILNKEKPDQSRFTIEKYDYEVESGTQNFSRGSAEIRYTYTYDCAAKGDTYTAQMYGKTCWVQGEYGSKTYIYMFQYETLANCEECIESFDMLLSDSFESVFDLDYIQSLQ